MSYFENAMVNYFGFTLTTVAVMGRPAKSFTRVRCLISGRARGSACARLVIVDSLSPSTDLSFIARSKRAGEPMIPAVLGLLNEVENTWAKTSRGVSLGG